MCPARPTLRHTAKYVIRRSAAVIVEALYIVLRVYELPGLGQNEIFAQINGKLRLFRHRQYFLNGGLQFLRCDRFAQQLSRTHK